jgi:hypothetical protein
MRDAEVRVARSDVKRGVVTRAWPQRMQRAARTVRVSYHAAATNLAQAERNGEVLIRLACSVCQGPGHSASPRTSCPRPGRRGSLLTAAGLLVREQDVYARTGSLGG